MNMPNIQPKSTSQLGMHWADYRKGSKKAKIHLGFNLNHAIPSKIFFTDGKGAERPFVDQIISSGQTVVPDGGDQKHTLFDSLQLSVVRGKVTIMMLAGAQK